MELTCGGYPLAWRYGRDDTPEEFDIFMSGFQSGRASGWDDGYAACEERQASNHRYALEVMRRSGRLDLSPDEILGD